MKTVKPFRKHPKTRGSILVLVAGSMLVFIAFVALVTDVGFMYYQKARIESAVSAGWKAGLDLMSASAIDGSGFPTDQTAITARVRDVIKKSFPDADDTSKFSLSVTFPSPGFLQVVGHYSHGLFFATAMGFERSTAGASRGGTGGPGIIPIGVPHGKLRQANTHEFTFDKFEGEEQFTVGEEYIIRLGNVKSGGVSASHPCTVCGGTGTIPTPGAPCGICGGGAENPVASCTTCGGDGVVGGTTGTCTNCGGAGTVVGGGPLPNLRSASNHGSLDMGSKAGGASDYEKYFKFGYPGRVDVGDLLPVKAGTMQGPNDEGRDHRLADPSRVRVVVPIVKCPDPSEADIVPQEKSGTKDQVEVIGFAIFDLIPVSNYTMAPLPDGLGSYDPDKDKDSDQVRGKFVGYLVKPS